MEKMTWKDIEARLEKRQYKQLIKIRQSYRRADYDDEEEDAMMYMYSFIALLATYLKIGGSVAASMATSLLWTN